MKQPLAKYKIGLGVIGLLTLGLLVLVTAQASGAKEDAITYKKASKIATSLNDYTTTKGMPKSLEDAGITDVPSSISYKKLSGGKYEFCVTYRADSGAFDAADVQTQLLTAGLGGGTGSSSYSDTDNNYEPSSLYLKTNHHKGKNCQTVKPYFYENNYNDYYDSSKKSGSGNITPLTNDTGMNCDVDAQGKKTSDEVYFACIDKKYGNPDSSTN